MLLSTGYLSSTGRNKTLAMENKETLKNLVQALEKLLFKSLNLYYAINKKACKKPLPTIDLDSEEEMALLEIRNFLVNNNTPELREDFAKLLDASQIFNSLKVYYYEVRHNSAGKGLPEVPELHGFGFYEKLILKIQTLGPQSALMDVLFLPELREWLPNLKRFLDFGHEDSFSDSVFYSDKWFYEKFKFIENKKDDILLGISSEKEFDINFSRDGAPSKLKLGLNWSKSVASEELMSSILNCQLNVDNWVQSFREIVPLISIKLESINVPPIESYGECFSVYLENIVLNCLKIESENIEIEILPQNAPGIYNCTRLPSHTARIISIKIKNIQAQSNDIHFAFEKKTRFFKFSDEGLLNLRIDGKGLEVTVLAAVETDPSKLLVQLKGLADIGNDISVKNNQEGVIEDIFSKPETDKKTSETFSATNLKTNIDFSKTSATNVFSKETFLEYPEKNSCDQDIQQPRRCPTENSDTSIENTSDSYISVLPCDIHEDEWDGDLSLWSFSEKVECIESSVVNLENTMPKYTGLDFKDKTLETIQCDNPLEVDIEKDVRIHEVFPSNHKNNSLREESSLLDDDGKKEYFDKSNFDHKSPQIGHRQFLKHPTPDICILENTDRLVVPSLPDISPQYGDSNDVDFLSSEQTQENTTPATGRFSGVDPSGEDFPLDLRQLVRIMSVRSSLQDVHIRIHNSSSDLLYRILRPFIEKLAKRHLEAAVRAVIIKLMRNWLESLLLKLISSSSSDDI